MTVSPSVIAAFIFAAAAELLLPIVILLVLCLKKKISLKPTLLGAAAFFVSQMCLRIPIMSVLATQSWYKAFALNLIPYFIALGFTAGLFEESTRYVFAGCFLKKQRGFSDALAFGLGHGFCEVILVAGITQINNTIYAIAINNETFSSMAAQLPAATSQQLLSSMTALKPTLIFVGILERVFAVTFHVFATVLIFKGLNEHKIRYYFLALGAHAVLDFGSGTLAQYTNVWAAEGFACLIAAASLFLIFKMKPSFQQKTTATANYEQILKQQ